MPKKFSCLNAKCTSVKVHLSGSFVRKSDSKVIQRYRCSLCKRSFSTATFHPCYRQKKRNKNFEVLKYLCSSVSQRRTALNLNLNLKTVAGKFLFWSEQAARLNAEYLESLRMHPLELVYVDEMEDKEHTKCKPLSIAMMVSPERRILGHSVSPIMPKNRRLNSICRTKYPYWKDESKEGFRFLLRKEQGVLSEDVEIKSDEKLMYKKEIKAQFPKATHTTYKSRSAVIAGLGELKEGGVDPLFPLNHTCAMVRANVNRMVRRTWCTTKKYENLSKHLEMYTYFHNQYLIKTA